jgi:hypothetical protein
MTAAPEDDTAARPVGRYEWEALLLRVEMPGPVKFLALVLATHADADGTRVRPGNARLVRITGQSKATVKRNLAIIRDDLRMLLRVSRGGGRNGQGRTTEYRLAIPPDLLDRVTLTPLEPTRSGLTIVSPQRDPEPEDSGLTVVSPQNEDSGLTQMSPENDFQGSNTAHPESMRAHFDSLRAHPGEPLPPTRPTTTDDQHVVTPPTQPTTARETDPEKIDPVESVELKPPKCIHGLRAHIRDGQPTCPLCRRLAPTEAAP